jgi:hypothetical protein
MRTYDSLPYVSKNSNNKQDLIKRCRIGENSLSLWSIAEGSSRGMCITRKFFHDVLFVALLEYWSALSSLLWAVSTSLCAVGEASMLAADLSMLPLAHSHHLKLCTSK